MSSLSAQLEDSLNFANELLLNSWERKPDSSIREFVKKYIPNLVSTGQGGWTTSAPLHDEYPQIRTSHAISFKKHRFFDGKYKDGEIKFLTLESNNVVNGILDIYLILNYLSQDSAEFDLSKLKSKFDNAAFVKKEDTTSNTKSVRFAPVSINKESNVDVQIFLFRNPIETNKYEILVRLRPTSLK